MSQLVYDHSDNYRRAREGGQNHVFESTHIHQKNDDNEKLFMKECQKLLDTLGYNKNIYEKIEMKLRKIESEQPCISPICLILAMKYTLQLSDFSLLSYPKEHMNEFLKKKWIQIDSLISKYGKKYFEQNTINMNNKPFHEEDYIRYKIYKSKIYPSSNIDRYIAIWKREILLHDHMVKKKNIDMKKNREKNYGIIKKDFNEMIRRKPDSMLYIDKVNLLNEEALYKIQADNGSNACWINTVLFCFFSHAILRKVMIYNDFVGKENYSFVEKMTRKKWGDTLYSFYYQIFEENCSDIEIYGEYGNPHSILSFLIDDIVKKEDIRMDMDFNLCLNSMEEFDSKIQKKSLYGIIKGTSPVFTNDLNTEHFVAFIRKTKDSWILFDALKGGTIDEKVTKEDIFFHEDNSFYGRESRGNCPYYFIYLESE